MHNLDLIDRKILYELDVNARIPITRLARKLRQSRERINYRIKQLEQEEIIRKYVTMINPSKLGYSAYKLYFKFQNFSKKQEDEAIAILMKNDFVYWIATCQGKWDLSTTIFAKDITHLEEILSPFISIYGRYIQEQEFNTTLMVGIMNKNWLLKEHSHGDKVVYVGGTVTDLKIDKIDVEILRILANNARMNAMQIAKKIKSTQRTIIYRMKELEKKGIILGYTTSLNLEKLGMQFFKANLYFNTITTPIKNKIIEYCKTIPTIGFFIFCFGNWPLELELIVKDNREYFGVMDKFREAFPELKGYETIIFPKEYKFDWMPLCYEAEK